MTETELLQYDIYLASLNAAEQFEIAQETVSKIKETKKSMRQIRYEIVKERIENMLTGGAK